MLDDDTKSQKELHSLQRRQPKLYKVHSAFLTLQGEGGRSGERAVFVRLGPRLKRRARAYARVPAPERFAKFWEPRPGPLGTPCHIWIGGIGDHGYGVFNDGTRLVGAHRFAFEQRHGPLPKGRWALHRCDVRACVNTEHVFAGTPGDNVRDMHAKGRAPVHARPRGDAHSRMKLSDASVAEIRALWTNRGKTGRSATGLTLKVLAERYGISPSGLHGALKKRKLCRSM